MPCKQSFSIHVEGKLNEDEIISFLARNFGDDYDQSLEVNRLMMATEPSIKPCNFVIARSDEGTLIGLVRIVERSFFVDGQLISSGGISSVAIDEDWRGQGVCRQIMARALSDMCERGFIISHLHARRAADGFYPKFGYAGVGRYVDLDILNWPDNATSALSLRPLEESDLDFCREQYERCYHVLAGTMRRTPAIWNYSFKQIQHFSSHRHAYVITKNNQPLGYMMVFGDALTEIAIDDVYFDDALALLPSVNVKNISLHPQHAFFRYCRRTRNTAFHERIPYDGGYMARLIDLDKALSLCAQRAQDNAASIGLRDQTLSLWGHVIDLNDGSVTSSQGDDDIVFERDDMYVHLLLGFLSVDDIPGVSINQDKPWIKQLFPSLDFHSCKADEI